MNVTSSSAELIQQIETGDGSPPSGGAALSILMVAPQPFFRPRGTPFSVLHRIRALSMLGHRVDLVTYPFGEPVTQPGLRIVRSARPPGVTDVRIGPSPAKVFLDASLFRTATRLLTHGNYDLIHTHEEAGALGAWLSNQTGIPHIYDMHSSLPQQFDNFGRYNWRPVVAAFERLEKYTLAGAQAVIAICPELVEHVTAQGYRGDLVLIENSMDFAVPDFTAAELAEFRRELGVENRPTVVYTGTIEHYQGLELLVEGADMVVQRIPDVRFLIVGGEPTQSEPLRRLAIERGVQEHFVFVPAVPPMEVHRYQRLADVLVTTRARGTNTPLKIYQYLRARKPIVATRIRSHTQVLDDGSAEMVDLEPAAIAAGIVRVLEDPARAAALSAASGRLAAEVYSQDSYIGRLRDLLARLPLHRPLAKRIG